MSEEKYGCAKASFADMRAAGLRERRFVINAAAERGIPLRRSGSVGRNEAALDGQVNTMKKKRQKGDKRETLTDRS